MITKADIERYFIAEKSESLVFVSIGAIAILLALAGLFIWKNQYWKGASIPLIIIALIQITVGYTIYKRSDEDRIRVVYALDMNPDGIKAEHARMEKVNKSFVIYKWIEIALLLSGVALFFIYRNNAEKQFWLGLGIALAIQSATMLAADYFAERRALVYTNQLKTVK